MNLSSLIPSFDISIGRKASRRPNKLLSFLLPQWLYGKALWHDRDYTKMLEAYRDSVYICASRNATGVAQSKLRLYVAKPNKKVRVTRFATEEVSKETRDYIRSNSSVQTLDCVRKATDFEEILEHPILTLMKNVNPFMNAFDLWELTTLFQELTGNAYWYIVSKNKFGVPDEVWPMPADKMMVIPDAKKFISGYKYVKEFGNLDTTIKNFEESEIIHFKYPNPRSFYYGLSPLAAVSAAYNISQNMSDYELAVFKNMGRLEGAFETKEALADDEFDRLKKEIAEAFYGVKKAGQSPLLENGVTYKQYGWNPRELSFTNGRKYTKEEIFNAYGVPMGLYDPAANRANADAAIYNWAKNSLRPRCMRMEQKLNEKLSPRYDPNIFLMFEDVVPEDLELATKIRESNLKNGLTSRDEERKKLRMPELPNGIGAEPMMQVQYAPLSVLMSGEHPLKGAPVNISPENNPKPAKPVSTEEPKKALLSRMTEEQIANFVDEVLNQVRRRIE